MNERIDELSKIIDFLKEENKRIEKNKLHFSGYQNLISQNREYILRLEKRVDELEDEAYQEERRQEVRELR